jgi:hypothetical protein
MFGTEFGEKCIIMQFLGGKKRRKNTLNAEFAETQRKDLRKIRGEKPCKEPGRPEGGPYAFFR